MMPNNPFCVHKRALGLYDALASDLKNESDNILSSLPQFLRMALIEGNNSWGELFNTYDLLTMIAVSNDFGTFISVDNTFEATTKIQSATTDTSHIETTSFLSAPLIRKGSDSFSVQDFILSIAYHGSFHLAATKRPELGTLYDDFISKHASLSMRMAREIAACFIKAFKELRSIKDGSNNGYNNVNHRQPLIVEAGNLVAFSDGDTACLYNNSYMQFPVREKASHGIRVCIDLQLTGRVEKGVIFMYGHRKHGKILKLSYDRGAILATCHNGAKTKCIPIRQIPAFEMKPRKVELALYPDGTFVVAIDEHLFKTEDTSEIFQVKNGKLILGADLDANQSGSFLCSCISIESIDRNSVVSDIHFSGNRTISSNAGLKIEPMLFARRALH